MFGLKRATLVPLIMPNPQHFPLPDVEVLRNRRLRHEMDMALQGAMQLATEVDQVREAGPSIADRIVAMSGVELNQEDRGALWSLAALGCALGGAEDQLGWQHSGSVDGRIHTAIILAATQMLPGESRAGFLGLICAEVGYWFYRAGPRGLDEFLEMHGDKLRALRAAS